jgi:hypothetical protein
MNDLSVTTITRPVVPSRALRAVRSAARLLLGALGGFVLGVAARAWMRLISDDPEFTWSGTLGIVIGFTIFGFTQAVGRQTRISRRRWVPTVGRVVGIVGLLPLFVAAGGQMMPTVVAGGFVVARPQMPKWAKLVCLAVASVPFLMAAQSIVDSRFGWSLRSVAGIVLMVALYVIIVLVARPTFAARLDGRRVPPAVTVVVLSLLGLLFAGLAVGAQG